jgi:hypothetical protein
MVDATLKARKRNLVQVIEADTAKLEVKRGKWDASVINYIQEELQQKKDTVCSITSMMSSEKDKKHQQRFNQMKKRRAKKLFEEKRIKQRSRTTDV